MPLHGICERRTGRTTIKPIDELAHLFVNQFLGSPFVDDGEVPVETVTADDLHIAEVGPDLFRWKIGVLQDFPMHGMKEVVGEFLTAVCSDLAGHLGEGDGSLFFFVSWGDVIGEGAVD